MHMTHAPPSEPSRTRIIWRNRCKPARMVTHFDHLINLHTNNSYLSAAKRRHSLSAAKRRHSVRRHGCTRAVRAEVSGRRRQSQRAEEAAGDLRRLSAAKRMHGCTRAVRAEVLGRRRQSQRAEEAAGDLKTPDTPRPGRPALHKAPPPSGLSRLLERAVCARGGGGETKVQRCARVRARASSWVWRGSWRC